MLALILLREREREREDNSQHDFINDCLIFSIFHGNNRISVREGDNHWIPFDEFELGVTSEPFKFNTLHKYLIKRRLPEELSTEARAVYDAGLAIFKHYHMGNNGKPHNAPDAGRHECGGNFSYNPNAAMYDIRQFFQGTKKNGHMKVKSDCPVYQAMNVSLREKMRILRDVRISPKVYEYGFLLK